MSEVDPQRPFASVAEASEHAAGMRGALSDHPGCRHAVLIMAHSQPRILSQAMEVYSRLGWDVYVHLDAKIAIDDYVSALGSVPERCCFTSTRHEVFWMGYSMVEAALTLMGSALDSGNAYTRMTLLSDDSLPMWNDKDLMSWAATKQSWVQLIPQQSGDLGWQRYFGFYYWDHATTARRRVEHNPQVDDKMIAAIEELATLKRLGKKSIDVVCGSQWWSMTSSRIEQLLVDVNSDRHLQMSFRYSEVPDESYFPTLIAKRCGDDIYNRGACHVDWNGPPFPRVFRDKSELAPYAKEYPFARKFTADV